MVGAKIYRKFLLQHDEFTSLKDKIKTRPKVADLAGAAHIYVWGKGPLKPEDILGWRKLVRKFGREKDIDGAFSKALWEKMPQEFLEDLKIAFTDALGESGFVSQFSRQTFTRALNTALMKAVPLKQRGVLPGNHDLEAQTAWIASVRETLQAEFPGHFKSPERWGEGISMELVEKLKAAGIPKAWIGIENWLDAVWHPEAVQYAKDEGYLIGTYDSYASAHPSNQDGTWETAQMGDTIHRHSAYRREDGSVVAGFRGKGVYANPTAIESYAKTRMAAISKEANLNSYFLDVDATGLIHEDYSEGRQTTKADAVDALKRRMNFATDTLGLVLGSETGVSAFASEVDFSHGMMTPYFAWMDRRMQTDRSSEFFMGTYWPPEAPSYYFGTAKVPSKLMRAMYDPAFRLPLYQVALHDSVSTTHHWDFGTLKFPDLQQTNELLQLLYMVPPLYHVSHSTLSRDLPSMSDYMSEFGPLHSRLFDQQLIGFEFMSIDRLVQRTDFADGTSILVNFDSTARRLDDGVEVPPQSGYVELPDGTMQRIGLGTAN